MAATLRQTAPAALSKSTEGGARRLPFAVMLVVFGLYLLTMSGHTYSPDEETMLAAAQSLVTHAGWDLPPSRALVEVTGVDGKRYSQYGPGQSIAAVPWVIVGRAVGDLFPKDQAGFPLRLLLATYNALVAAGICGLTAAAALALGCGARSGFFTAGALAFGTFLWPHSRTFFSEPLVALLLLGSFYLLLRAPAAGRWWWTAPIFSGLLFAGAAATKAQYAVALPAFLLYLAWRWLANRRSTFPNGTEDEKGKRVSIFEPVLWAVGLVVGLVPLFLYNLAIFGSALTTGYGADLKGTFNTPLIDGASGLLFSSGKGLLCYALPVLLSIWGVVAFARKHKAEATFIGLMFALVLALFGTYRFWPGDGSWGPRYLIPVLPFLMLPAASTFESAFGAREGARRANRPLATISAVVVVLGFVVNLLGSVVNFDTYLNIATDDAMRYWRPDNSPIAGHAQLLGQRVAEWTTRLRPSEGTVLFREGFSYSEGDKAKGDLLPRWTTGRAALDIRPYAQGPAEMTLLLTDHRPPELPRAVVSILLNGNPAQAEVSPVDGKPDTDRYKLVLPEGQQRVIVTSDTWNPSTLQKGGRDEDLGVMLEGISFRQGGQNKDYRLIEALPAPAYYPQPRWYYDPGTHHPADFWLFYLFETGMGRKAALAVALPVIFVGLLCLFLGWRRLRGPA